MRISEPLPLLYVITTNTKDYGEKFVIRKHMGNARAWLLSGIVDTLEEARLRVWAIARMQYQDTFKRLDRIPEDDPVIVESWGPAAYVAELRAMVTTVKPGSRTE